MVISTHLFLLCTHRVIAFQYFYTHHHVSANWWSVLFILDCWISRQWLFLAHRTHRTNILHLIKIQSFTNYCIAWAPRCPDLWCYIVAIDLLLPELMCTWWIRSFMIKIAQTFFSVFHGYNVRMFLFYDSMRICLLCYLLLTKKTI